MEAANSFVTVSAARRMPIDDEINVCGRAVQQPLAEAGEDREVGVALVDREPQRAS